MKNIPSTELWKKAERCGFDAHLAGKDCNPTKDPKMVDLVKLEINTRPADLLTAWYCGWTKATPAQEGHDAS